MKGRGKGGAFERECSRRLSLWLTAGARDEIFWRTAMSGGRATLQHRKGIVNKSQAGDIGAIDADGERLLTHIVIECKARRDMTIFRSLLTGEGRLADYWEKHYMEARRSKRQPFMIARENFVPTLLFTTETAVILLGITKRPVLEIAGWAPRADLTRRVVMFLFDDVVPRIKDWD